MAGLSPPKLIVSVHYLLILPEASGVGPFAFITYVNDCKTLGHDKLCLKIC